MTRPALDLFEDLRTIARIEASLADRPKAPVRDFSKLARFLPEGKL
jgi:hypothetical protein